MPCATTRSAVRLNRSGSIQFALSSYHRNGVRSTHAVVGTKHLPTISYPSRGFFGREVGSLTPHGTTQLCHEGSAGACGKLFSTQINRSSPVVTLNCVSPVEIGKLSPS